MPNERAPVAHAGDPIWADEHAASEATRPDDECRQGASSPPRRASRAGSRLPATDDQAVQPPSMTWTWPVV